MLSIVRSISVGLCFLGSVAALRGQTPPAAAPAPWADPANAQNGSQGDSQTIDSSTYQLKVNVKRVILDVVVTDANGNPVRGLTRNDFKVSEDGVPQSIRSFDVHSASAVAGEAQQPLNLHLPPDTFSNLTIAPPDKPVTILLYDALNTPQASLPYAHAALVQFIKSQKGTTRIAIFALTDRLHMLQGFTDDETRLMLAIDSKNLKGHVSQLKVADTTSVEANMLAGDPAQIAKAQLAYGPATAAAPPIGTDAVLTQLQNAEAEESAYQVTQRLETTVQAFTDLARFVSALPGRKNLIWMSGSFPSAVFPDDSQLSGAQNEFNNYVSFNTEILMAQNEMKDSRVAVYPVDVRGLQTDPQFSAATNFSGPPPTQVTFNRQNNAEHSTMDAIADATGGHAFYNTNGLQEAMDTAIKQGSDYYTLTYAPTNTKADGGDRKVKVSLSNPSYTLAYRHHYTADDAKHPHALLAEAQDLDMQHGAPDSSQLFFEAKAEPIGGVMQASPDEEEALRSFLETNAKINHAKTVRPLEKVQHYGVYVLLLGRQLDMPRTERGNYLTSMRYGLAAYTADGELLNGAEISVKNAIPPAQYQKIATEGYHTSIEFAVPVDATSLRIAVRDEIGNKIGSIEVPLPPAPAATTASATK